MPNPANHYIGYVEDAEEDCGSSVGGIESTRKYAMSEAPPSPTKPNTGKTRGEVHILHPDTDEESVSSISLADESDETARKREPMRISEPRRPVRSEREHVRAPRREYAPDHGREPPMRREKKHPEAPRRGMRPEPPPKQMEPRPMKKTRPPGPKHAATQPVIQQTYGKGLGGHREDPAFYGVSQPATSRPRAKTSSRPSSYYGQPPPRQSMGNMSWSGPPGPPPPPPGSFPAGSFPPPPMFPGPGPSPGHMHHPGAPPPPSPIGPPGGYFDGFMGGPPPPHHHHQPPPQELGRRFERRPSSAMGFQSPPSGMGYLPDEYDYAFEEEPRPKAHRRASRSKKPDDDRKKMPPPEFLPKRTQSARPTTGAFKPPSAHYPERHHPERHHPERHHPERHHPERHPPERHPPERHNTERRPPSRANQRPPASHRRSVGFIEPKAIGFDEMDFYGGGEDEMLFQEPPDSRRTALTRARRSSMVYDQGGMDIVPANSRMRRNSIYGIGALDHGGVSLEEDKYFDALRYQEDVSGGPGVPLTAESLRKASKRGEASSSRSTRSTASHDESEYKRSNTTGITRSSSGNNEDFTIKVSGAAVVRVSGAEIECNDGGRITVSGRGGPQGASRAGSDKESTIYQLEDTRSRIERKALPHRPRSSSHADSSRYAPSHAPLEHAPYEHIPYYDGTYELEPYAPYDPSLAASNFY